MAEWSDALIAQFERDPRSVSTDDLTRLLMHALAGNRPVDRLSDPGIQYLISEELKLRQAAPATQLGADTETDSDTPGDAEKKPKKSRKRGPRDASEFLRFKSKIEKAERQGRQKKDAAIEFTDGDVKKAKALLRKLYRHKDLPE